MLLCICSVMSKCGKNKKVAQEAQLSVPIKLLTHIGIFSD